VRVVETILEKAATMKIFNHSQSTEAGNVAPLRGWLILFFLVVLVFGLANLNVSAKPPAASGHSPAGYWLTDDGDAAVAFAPCRGDTATVCGVIRALPGIRKDPTLANFASELCGLPIIWDLTFNPRRNRWVGGSIVDPETEEAFSVTVWVEGSILKVHAYEGVEAFGETLNWTPTTASDFGCEAK
jgi:uncharacterized protein (DUF2147 family)